MAGQGRLGEPCLPRRAGGEGREQGAGPARQTALLGGRGSQGAGERAKGRTVVAGLEAGQPVAGPIRQRRGQGGGGGCQPAIVEDDGREGEPVHQVAGSRHAAYLARRAEPLTRSAILGAVRPVLPALLLCLGLLPTSAAAQIDALCEGGEPGPCAVTPLPGTPERVTLDAPIKVRYTEGFFEVFGVEGTAIEVIREDTGLPVAGSTQQLGSDLLFFVPDGGWEPETRYVGRVFGEGNEIAFGFQTGRSVDMGPPTRPRIVQVEASEGTALGEGAVRIDVEFEPSSDDGPLGSLEYQVYLTAGHDVVEPELRLRIRHQSTTTLVGAIGLTGEATSEPACMAIVAVDGVGRTASSETTCFDPVTGNYFEPLCSVAPAPSARGVAGVWLPLLAVWIGLGRRRGRRALSEARPIR